MTKEKLFELLCSNYGEMKDKEVQHWLMVAGAGVGAYDVFIERTLNDEFDVYEIYYVFDDKNADSDWQEVGYRFRICVRAPEKYLEKFGDGVERMVQLSETLLDNMWYDLFEYDEE